MAEDDDAQAVPAREAIRSVDDGLRRRRFGALLAGGAAQPASAAVARIAAKTRKRLTRAIRAAWGVTPGLVYRRMVNKRLTLRRS